MDLSARKRLSAHNAGCSGARSHVDVRHDAHHGDVFGRSPLQMAHVRRSVLGAVAVTLALAAACGGGLAGQTTDAGADGGDGMSSGSSGGATTSSGVTTGSGGTTSSGTTTSSSTTGSSSGSGCDAGTYMCDCTVTPCAAPYVCCPTVNLCTEA